jgi:hypothetical protein
MFFGLEMACFVYSPPLRFGKNKGFQLLFFPKRRPAQRA